MRSIAFNTLGCRLNQYETDALVSTFRDAGYRIVKWNEQADAYVINTCTVTERSDRKSRALVYQALRAAEAGGDRWRASGAADGRTAARGALKAAAPVVLVTGCFVENEGQALDDGRITYVVDNDRKAFIFDIIDGHLNGAPVDPGALTADRFSFGDSGGGFHTRRAIKIQDGCDNFCTFCIIPHVRGKAVSMPAPQAMRQASEAIGAGAKEIVITGVNIGRYRHNNVGFSELLGEILDLDGDFRVRVSSIEPDSGKRTGSWESGFLNLVNHPKLCPHLHLCVQSGSDRILEAMDRRYGASDIVETVKAVRERRADFNFTTDVMVGFPGESEEDFSQTLQLIEEVGFSHIHTFPFSVRPGTLAADLGSRFPHVRYEEKARRAKEVREISAIQKCRYRESFIGKSQLMLVESVTDGVASGYGEHYLPIEMPVGSSTGSGRPEKGNIAVNSFVPVEVTGIGPGQDSVLRGSIIC